MLRIDLGNAIPGEHALRLLDPNTSLPTRPPDIPGRRLTGLWLIPEWERSFTYWTANDGWRRFHVDPSAGSPSG